MRLFISYRYTGEILDELQAFLQEVCSSLRLKNQVYCSIEEQFDGWDLERIYTHCVTKLSECDAVLFFVRRESQSTGMRREAIQAKALNKKLIVFHHESVKPDFAFSSLALGERDAILIVYGSPEDLHRKLTLLETR